MPRVTDFDDAYAESRGRLLLQLYAYCGDADAADDALDEAFIAASRHWHRLSSLENLDPWLRDRATKRLDTRPRPLGAAPKQSGESGRLLRALSGLDRVTRRLLIVRRLDDTSLAQVAREVGLTDAAAEQALARAAVTLHAAGVDTTPVGLRTQLTRLGDDLRGRGVVPGRTLRQAGIRRRYALTLLLGLALVAAAALAGTISAARPLATPGTAQRPTSSPGHTSTSSPVPQLGTADLISANQVSTAAGTPWVVLPVAPPPVSASVYGDCVLAADNPPPDSSWIRVFTPAGPQTGRWLRQVMLLAPSDAEAKRAYKQAVAGFAACAGHQLVDFATADDLGDQARIVTLRLPSSGGAVAQTVVIAKSGPAVVVLLAQSAAGTAVPLSPGRLVFLTAAALDHMCARHVGRCPAPPYPIRQLTPPRAGTAGGFLSFADLPLVPGITAAWAAGDATHGDGRASGLPCGLAGLRAGAGSSTRSRAYEIPHGTKLPSQFGLSEAMASFSDPGAAQAFVTSVVAKVTSCHAREPAWSVRRSAAFSSPGVNGTAWELTRAGATAPATSYRVALVRNGSRVAEVRFSPAGGYDVSSAAFEALAKRAAARLTPSR